MQENTNTSDVAVHAKKMNQTDSGDIATRFKDALEKNKKKKDMEEVTSLISSLAKQSKKTESEVEKKWEKAKWIVKKKYPDIKKDSEKFFKLTTGVLKNMLSIDESLEKEKKLKKMLTKLESKLPAEIEPEVD